MISSKVHFPLPLREGIKGRGKLHPEIQSLIAPTLTLPREGGGNFRLLTSASNFVFPIKPSGMTIILKKALNSYP
jgi:hypothetical protein